MRKDDSSIKLSMYFSNWKDHLSRDLIGRNAISISVSGQVPISRHLVRLLVSRERKCYPPSQAIGNALGLYYAESDDATPEVC